MKAAEEEKRQLEQSDRDKYGRYWMWEFYCDSTSKALIEGN